MPIGQPFTVLCRQMSRPRLADRADLHLHTTYSDGQYSPVQIVDLARRSGLAAIAITDHDTVAGIEPTRLAAGRQIEVIAGIELTAEYRGREFHLLGYFLDTHHPELLETLDRLKMERATRYHETVDRLRRGGVQVPIKVPKDNGTLGRRHVAELLVEAKLAPDVRQAFSRFLGDGSRFHVPKRRLPAGEAIALLRRAGAVTSWAHPNQDCDRDMLAELEVWGLHAVEATFPSCKATRSRNLRRLASELGLAVTAGSDCHGPGQPARSVGACTVSCDELSALRRLAATR